MDFDVISTVTISQLGVFDSGSNGLSSPINVRIYNRNTQAVVASLAFAAGQSGTLINGSRFMALATPLTLSAGFQGVIEADGYNASELNGNTISQVTNTGGGAISFVGTSRYGSAGQYPGNLDGQVAQYLAGTFQYVVGTSVSTGTGGTQSYSGPVTLAAATTLTTTNSAVTFGGTVDGAQALTISTGSGATTFSGIVGGGTALASLSITGSGGVSQGASAQLIVSGSTTLAAGSSTDITLSHASNNFGSVIITSARNVTLVDVNAIVLGAGTVSGTLSVTAGGAITQSGALVVTGSTTLAAGSANDITLGTSTNNFATVSITSGNNVTLADTNAIVLGASTVSGNFSLTTSGGAITQSGALLVTGTTTLNTGAAAITLTYTTSSNSFGGRLSITNSGANAVAVYTSRCADAGRHGHRHRRAGPARQQRQPGGRHHCHRARQHEHQQPGAHLQRHGGAKHGRHL